MDKKYQIFISSTYKDLIEEREKVRDVILSMYQFPIGMEMFSAADEDQWEIIKETIDSSDYYVLIIGKRYGSIIDHGPEKGISYTEKEYRYAKSIDLPILAYIKNDTAITADNVDDDPEKIKKLQVFKDDITKGREVKWFSSIDQLGTEVTLSLHKEMKRKKRPGWIRGDAVDIEKSLSEIVELSKKNRELSEENLNLRGELEKIKSSFERKPQLAIRLGLSKPEKNEKHLEFYQRNELMKIDEEGIVHLKMRAFPDAKDDTDYQPLSYSDVPEELKDRISEKDISDYNAMLPTEEEKAEYIQNCNLYLCLKNNGIATTLYVDNIGTAKATDVSVRIIFPEQIRVFYLNEIIRIAKPKAPEKPENPIQKTYALIDKARKLPWEVGHQDVIGKSSINKYSNLTQILANKLASNDIKVIEIVNNTVEFEDRQGIVHTKSKGFDGAYILPCSVGNYEAKVIIMCAEYDNPEERTIRFVVEK